MRFGAVGQGRKGEAYAGAAGGRGRARARRRGCLSPRTRQPLLPSTGSGAAYGCWKPASWRTFCASGVLSQATNAAAASVFLDCFSVAAG